MRCISVVGSTGSGKTTVAAAIGEALDVPVVELDAIHWGPDWTPVDRDEIRRQVSEIVADGAWVIDGNYRGMAQDLVWAAADTIVWLDLPFHTNAWQLMRRTLRRSIRRERLWSDNRESLWKAVFSRDSILRWLVRTHRKNRKRYLQDMTSAERSRPVWVRLRTRTEVDSWLAGLS